MPFDISVRVDVKELTRNLGYLADKQIPFATAQALNALGAIVKETETQNIKATFPTATPFTQNAVAVLKASKSNPTVTILVKDRTARYLNPYEVGGVHVLNSRALLNPKNVTLNQYGNIPKGKLAALKAMPGVFVGTVKTKAGPISGVWQRPTPAPIGKGKKMPRGANTTGKLKLLIRFGDALPVKQRLHYQSKAKAIVAANFAPCFNAAMARALASAKG